MGSATPRLHELLWILGMGVCFKFGLHTFLTHLNHIKESPKTVHFLSSKGSYKKEWGGGNGLVFPSYMKHFYVLFMQSEKPFPLQLYKLNLLL